MHRLFVAAVPPTDIRALLLSASGGVPGARWQSDAQLHLTLRFIGEVDRHVARDIAAALGSLHHPTFTICLDGIGHFDRKGRMEALWASVTPHAPLKSLHNKINQALVRVGVPADSRAFLPHITLARFSKGQAPVVEAAASLGNLSSQPFQIRDFCLFESDLGSTGANYSIIERYPLADSSGLLPEEP